MATNTLWDREQIGNLWELKKRVGPAFINDWLSFTKLSLKFC